MLNEVRLTADEREQMQRLDMVDEWYNQRLEQLKRSLFTAPSAATPSERRSTSARDNRSQRLSATTPQRYGSSMSSDFGGSRLDVGALEQGGREGSRSSLAQLGSTAAASPLAGAGAAQLPKRPISADAQAASRALAERVRRRKEQSSNYAAARVRGQSVEQSPGIGIIGAGFVMASPASSDRDREEAPVPPPGLPPPRPAKQTFLRYRRRDLSASAARVSRPTSAVSLNVVDLSANANANNGQVEMEEVPPESTARSARFEEARERELKEKEMEREKEREKEKEKGKEPGKELKVAAPVVEPWEPIRPSSASAISVRSSFAHYRPSSGLVERKMEDIWRERREREMEDGDDDQEFERTMQSWSNHRARVEGEIIRRLESSRWASKTGASSAAQTARAASAAAAVASPRTAIPVPVEDDQDDEDDDDEDEQDQGNRGGGVLKQRRPESVRLAGDSFLSTYMNVALPPKPLDFSSLPHGILPPHGDACRIPLRGAQTERTFASSAPGKVVIPTDAEVALMQMRSAPSLRRIQQAREVEKIKQAFVKKGLPISIRTIERSLVCPEDRPYEECHSALPRPGSALYKDPVAPPPKAKKGKKGKKGKKK